MPINPLRAGLESSREANSFALVIFGVTGDLTRKKLMPALFSLFLKGRISRFRIIGFARRSWKTDGLRREAAAMLDGEEFSAVSTVLRETFLNTLEYCESSFENGTGYRELERLCAPYPNRIFYLSTPPEAYSSIIENLGRAGLSAKNVGFCRIIVEKPFGRDLASARELNARLAAWFSEDQIYRIDHYLGKETVQNIMLLRFGNTIFEPIWNNRYIHHVQITVAEKLGVGTRGNYYETAGALRDMVQNHMFQLLALTAMEPINDLSADTIRTEKLKVLTALRPITHENQRRCAVRAQYARGHEDGRPVPGYLEEKGVDPASRTETFAALRLYIDTWRWSGVPFYLRTGKRLTRRVSEIAVQFKDPPLGLFGQDRRNTLIIRIQPEEGITFTMNAKIPGHTSASRPVNMDFAYGSSFGESAPEAYERLLLDALTGDSTLYTRRDEIEASWAFITRILSEWESDAEPLPQYRPGTSGPEEAKKLMEDARWRKL